jgi:glycosyltransferase involved in cell wall biosynthesis
VPVIAPHITAIPELLGHGEGGILVPPADPAALADAVARVVHGETDTRALARNAFRLIQEQFNLETNSRRFADFLEQRLSRSY